MIMYYKHMMLSIGSETLALLPSALHLPPDRLHLVDGGTEDLLNLRLLLIGQFELALKATAICFQARFFMLPPIEIPSRLRLGMTYEVRSAST